MKALLLKLSRLVVGAMLLLGGGANASAQGGASFYKGKTVFIYIGFAPGGSYDYFGRVVARYLGRHLPGNPTVVAAINARSGQLHGGQFSFHPRTA